MDYTLGVNSTLPVSESDRLMLGANAHGGSSDYNRTYFGVSPEQSARSGYRQHQTKAGIYGYSATAGWEHQLDENWTTGANVGVMHLTGKAGDSPVVKKKTSATGMATVRYNFWICYPYPHRRALLPAAVFCARCEAYLPCPAKGTTAFFAGIRGWLRR